MSQTVLRITLFGGMSVSHGLDSSEPLPSRQTGLLLAMLADQLGVRVQRRQLIETMWPYAETAVAQNRLRVALTYLRRLAEPVGTPSGAVVKSDRSSVSLSAEGAWVDVIEFNRRLERASRSDEPRTVIAALAGADELYRGEFLSGWEGDWVEGRRAHFARLQALAQHRHSGLLAEAGQRDAAVRQVLRAIEADPLREAPRRRLLRFLVEAGDVRSSVEEFERYAKLLRREVGLSPTAELSDWVRAVRASRNLKPLADEVASPPYVGLPASSDVELMRTEPVGPNHLPPTLTKFLGRTAEIAELSEVLIAGRLICLTGPGGVGKTRLAIAVARAHLPDYEAGVFFVSVAETGSPFALLESLARQAGVEPSADPINALKAFFDGRRVSGRNAALILLDGCEHQPKGADEVRRRILTEFPNVTILATSRRRLGLPGELEYVVGPLPVPEEGWAWEELAQNPSVRLFVERARLVAPRFVLNRASGNAVSQLCRRLEGIPLSVELAAARLKGSTVAKILADLDDLGSLTDRKGWREQRHRSLYDNLMSSLTALPPSLQAAFAGLAVFRGSFEAEAARAITGTTGAELELLCDHSLVAREVGTEEKRYRMLGTVREFAWGLVPGPEREPMAERHAAYFREWVALAEGVHLRSGRGRQTNLRTEVENMRQALEWSLSHASADVLSKFILGQVWTWFYFGSQQEGRDFVHRIRARVGSGGIVGARLDAAEGLLACYQDDPEVGRPCLTRALAVFERESVGIYESIVRGTLGFAEYQSGQFETALDLAGRNHAAAIAANLERWIPLECHLLGLCLCQVGRADEAAQRNHEADRMWMELGDVAFRGYAHLGLGRAYWTQGVFDEARGWYLRAMNEYEELNDPRCFAYSVEGLGRVVVSEGRFAEGARLLGAAQRVRDSIALSRDFVDGRDFASAMESIDRELGPAGRFEWSAGYGLAPKDVAPWVRGALG